MIPFPYTTHTHTRVGSRKETHQHVTYYIYGYARLSGQIRQSKGLVSIDRSVVAALLRTTPRPRPKSSAIDLASPLRWVGFAPHKSQGGGIVSPAKRTLFSGFIQPIGPEGSTTAVSLPPVVVGSRSTVTLPGGIPT